MSELPESVLEALRIAGRHYGGTQTRIEHTCATCGTQFRAPSKARYCSSHCRVRAFRDRAKAEKIS